MERANRVEAVEAQSQLRRILPSALRPSPPLFGFSTTVHRDNAFCRTRLHSLHPVRHRGHRVKGVSSSSSCPTSAAAASPWLTRLVLRRSSRRSPSSSSTSMQQCVLSDLASRTECADLTGSSFPPQIVEAEVTVDEWLEACDLLIEAGKVSSEKRNEMVHRQTCCGPSPSADLAWNGSTGTRLGCARRGEPCRHVRLPYAEYPGDLC